MAKRAPAGRPGGGTKLRARRRDPFSALLGTVQQDTDAHLERLLDARVDCARKQGRAVGEMLSALRDLCERGGKRLRPALVSVGARSVRTDLPAEPILQAGVALELLQAYFLIHDDWMDQDLERRGGPTVHTHLARRFRSVSKGASAAILAGDYAAALATEVISKLAVPPRRLPAILQCFAEMQLDAVAGQALDVVGESRDVELTYRLKTASYTVRGPLVLGALLAGGTAPLRRSLEQFSIPAGVAFQLRDDIIGVFGDPARTGKPRGGDLRAGKYTLLVELALQRCEARDRKTLTAVLKARTPTSRQVDAAIALLETSGAKAAVEARIVTLSQQARQVLEKSKLTAEGRELLLGALAALTTRDA